MPEEAMDFQVYLLGLKLENIAKLADHPTTQEGLTKRLKAWLDEFPPFQQCEWVMNSKYEATLTACNQLDKVPSETSNAVTFAAKVQGISRQEYWSKLYERVEKKTYDAIDDY